MTASRRLGSLLLLAALLPGCASYFLVQSRFVVGKRPLETPEVTETPLYTQVRDAVKVLALRPPDSCEDRGVSRSAGDAEFQGNVMRTRCGVEMAELEKALAKSGYLVVSWEAIKDRAAADEVSPIRAAEELDVDVLLQVNSLERSRVDPGSDARWERRFYHSSRNAEVGGPARVMPNRARVFEQMIAPEEQRLAPRVRLSATIDANAVLVANKTSIWFYRWTISDAPAGDPLAEVHVRCESEICTPQILREAAPSEGPVEGSIVAVSVGSQAADADQVVYHDLTRRLIEDMAARFAGAR